MGVCPFCGERTLVGHLECTRQDLLRKQRRTMDAIALKKKVAGMIGFTRSSHDELVALEDRLEHLDNQLRAFEPVFTG